jgi:hypothetical protein
MKLKKINEEHYVVVDETIQPVNGYYYDFLINKIKSTNGAEYGEASHCWQITHSTQPIEQYYGATDGTIPFVYHKINELPLSEVKELLGEVDVEKKAEQEYREYPNNPKEHPDWQYSRDTNCHKKRKAFIKGYNQALEDNKEKKYTEEQLIWAIQEAYGHGQNDEFDGVNKAEKSIIVITNYLHPKTEWEVEFINGKLTLI